MQNSSQREIESFYISYEIDMTKWLREILSEDVNSKAMLESVPSLMLWQIRRGAGWKLPRETIYAFSVQTWFAPCNDSRMVDNLFAFWALFHSVLTFSSRWWGIKIRTTLAFSLAFKVFRFLKEVPTTALRNRSRSNKSLCAFNEYLCVCALLYY